MKNYASLMSLCSALAMLSVNTVSAATFDYGATANFIEIPSGMLSAVNNAVRVGTFPTGFDFSVNATNYQATNAAFTLYDTTAIGAGFTSAGQFFDTTPNLTGITGNRLYIWAFNSIDPSTATAWAIVSNPSSSWVGPADAGTTTIDTSDAGTFVPTGALGSIVTTTGPVGFDVRMSPVPEPSTYVLLGLGLGGLTFGAIRRRQAVGTLAS